LEEEPYTKLVEEVRTTELEVGIEALVVVLIETIKTIVEKTYA
jgi:hypothetical protein